MQKSKIRVDTSALNRIVLSTKISNSDKINFMKYLAYMTISEKKELLEMI